MPESSVARPSASPPWVGITLSVDRGKIWRPGRDYVYVARAYSERLRAAGAEPLLLTPDVTPERAAQLCQAVVITGGDDLPQTPAEFEALCRGEGAGDPLGPGEDLERIRWERELIEAAAAHNKPLLGICYGMQLLNLHYGGTLYRDVHQEHPGAVDHGGSGRLALHRLQLAAPSCLFPGGPAEHTVNSNHRQAVHALASGFTATSYSHDGVLESMERGTQYGVQWHPETDEGGLKLLQAFVEQAT